MKPLPQPKYLMMYRWMPFMVSGTHFLLRYNHASQIILT